MREGDWVDFGLFLVGPLGAIGLGERAHHHEEEIETRRGLREKEVSEMSESNSV